MSKITDIDGQRFSFPQGWHVLPYDKSVFHRNHFQSFAGGTKALDLVAISPEQVLWLIEIKDYIRNRRSKKGTVYSEVAEKVKSTLAGLATARIRANNNDECVFANQAMSSRDLRVVLYLDQPRHNSRLFKQVVDPRTATKQLQRAVRAVDPHAICCGHGVKDLVMPWTVQRMAQGSSG
ncbi:MAG: hypothetical protein KKC76_16260 [Proteobacteria bacterium]|nr:hypothetical protein [Pseudomonadota bacterium]MBU4296073.1 hypothetical protein [Pseudomonadota bacterium]MCG2748009.1 hypothetical protein [Desulfobulbaceae bacterium]